MIAVIDHNCSVNLLQAIISDVTLRYKQTFSKISGGWCYKKDEMCQGETLCARST